MTTPAEPENRHRSLDPTDRWVIKLLADDPRTTYQTLSQQIGLSRAAIRARVEKLLSSRTVRIIGQSHPYIHGLTVAAELLVDTTLSAEQVATSLGDQPYARTGYADGLVTVSLWARDDGELSDLVDQLRAHPAICEVEVFRVVNLVRPQLRVPRAREENLAPLDETDHKLMGLLAADPRASFAHLSGQAGLSPSAAGVRVHRLLNTGEFLLAVTGSSGMSIESLRIGITVQAPAQAVALSLLQFPGLAYLALGHGRHDILARVITSPDKQHALHRRIRQTPGVENVRFWRTSCEDDLPVLLDHYDET